jgi:hypothetical protein
MALKSFNSKIIITHDGQTNLYRLFFDWYCEHKNYLNSWVRHYVHTYVGLNWSKTHFSEFCHRHLELWRLDVSEVDWPSVLVEPVRLRRPDVHATPLLHVVGPGGDPAQRGGGEVHLQVQFSRLGQSWATYACIVNYPYLGQCYDFANFCTKYLAFFLKLHVVIQILAALHSAWVRNFIPSSECNM